MKQVKTLGLWLLLIMMLAISFFWAAPTPVFAIDEPDTVKLSDIEVFHDLIVEDDFLAIVPYEIAFTAEPDPDIDKTFIFTMLSANGSDTIGSVLAYPRYNGGYGHGVVSFYYESGVALNINYIFRVHENPSYYPSPANWDFTIGELNYNNGTNQDDELRAKILDIALMLSNEFSVDLLTTSDAGQTVLSTYGELYFLYAVSGIQAMCPMLFSVQIESPTYTKRSWATTLSDSLRTKYNGTVIGDFMTGYAGLFSMETPSAMNILSVLLFVALILLSVWKFKATTIAAFQDGYALLLVLMLDGFFSMILAGFVAFVSILIGGIILFLNRS